MSEDPLALLPEILLVVGALAGLVSGMLLPRRRQWVVRALTAGTLLAVIAATAVAFSAPSRMVFMYSYAVDTGTNVTRLVVAAAALLAVCLSIDTVKDHPRETEAYVLMLLAALGTVLLAGSSDILLVAMAYLLASVPLYALAGFAKDAAGTEAALKFYLVGALLGVTMLVGFTVLFGVGGATTYRGLADGLASAPRGAVTFAVVAVLAGLLFKSGGVPGHFWVPDVTEGATAPVAAFVTTIPKVGALVALYRLLAEAFPDAPVDWRSLVAVIAAASMTLGNFAAFFQESPRRLLAYSTISQVGYLLLPVAVAGRSDLALPSLLFYVGAYAVTNLGAFAVVAELPRATTLSDYAGAFVRHPKLALTLVVCLLGLVGTPPTAVFFGKLTVFSAAIDGGFAWLAVVAVANSVVSVFYYLRWVAPMFLGRPAPERAAALEPAGTWSRVGAYAAGVTSLVLGIASAPAFALATGRLVS